MASRSNGSVGRCRAVPTRRNPECRTSDAPRRDRRSNGRGGATRFGPRASARSDSSSVNATLLRSVEFAAVAAFAYSGAETARRHGMDIVGVVALAVVNGLAGGVTRDVLIGGDVLALHDRWLLPVCVAAAVAVSLFGTGMPSRLVDVLDAIGLGLFTVLGTRRALDAGVTQMAAVLLGTVTVGAGGVLRDLLAGDRPALLYRSELYLIVSAIGATLYVAGTHTRVPASALLLGVAGLVTAGRLAALLLSVNSPVPGSRSRRGGIDPTAG